jgi:hypothetical protein
MQFSSEGSGLMVDFWLATYDLGPAEGMQLASGQPKDTTGVAIEVMHEGGQYGILVSWVIGDTSKGSVTLVCQVGFANESKICGVWADRGFPLLDAEIVSSSGTLKVTCPCYGLDQPELDYGATPVTISGLDDKTNSMSSQGLSVSYSQDMRTPDPVFSSSLIVQDAVTWSPTRSKVMESTGSYSFAITFDDTRYPVLETFRTAVNQPKKFWSGTIDIPEMLPPPRKSGGLSRANRDEIFGFPAFIFDDVEILGFRIDLSHHADPRELSSNLSELIRPLNFHLDMKHATDSLVPSALSDFKYKPATRTLNLELLRYGKMKLMNVNAPLKPDDFQSQHELALKVLVGRVDDDTAQARNPAIFVPAIFVDNTWSRTLGRIAQGFDKRMAEFVAKTPDGLKRLRPDGRLRPGTDPIPLGNVTEIRLQTNAVDTPDGALLLRLDCPSTVLDDKSFITVDPGLVYDPLPFLSGRWRQNDFDDEEFRRSFARDAMSKPFEGFESIQVTPVGGTDIQARLVEETTWITGTFKIDPGVKIAWPEGAASLTFRASNAAPSAWRDFCKLLGIDAGGKGTISLPSGNWYRCRLSTRLTISDGLP